MPQTRPAALEVGGREQRLGHNVQLQIGAEIHDEQAVIAVRGEEANDECDDLRTACHAYERRLLESALARCRYNQRATALALKLTYDQLRHALRRHDLLEKAAG